MARFNFAPGDKVQNLTRSTLVLEVVSVEGERVRCKTTTTLPATSWGTPAREIESSWLVPAMFLTDYNPRPLPKLEPIAVEIAKPARVYELTEVERLQLSHDGRIPQHEMEAARARDRVREAERAAALLATDGAALSVAAE